MTDDDNGFRRFLQKSVSSDDVGHADQGGRMWRKEVAAGKRVVTKK